MALFAALYFVLCSMPCLASDRIEKSITVDGLERQYVVWLPDGYKERQPMPVVLAFHGGGGQIAGMEDNAQLHMAALAKNFLIVYAAGYEKTFNAGGYCCGAAAKMNIDDVKFVHALLNDLDASVAKIDRHRVYATGFSNGGMLSYYLACNLSNEIAAIAPVSGAMQPPFDNCHPSRAVSVMHWEGLADKFDPFEGGQSAIKSAPIQPPTMQGIELWKKLDGARETNPVDIVGADAQCAQSTGSDKNAVVVLCLVPGLGHQWPGDNQKPGSLRVSRFFGPFGPPMDVNDAILTFFSNHPIR